MMFRFFLLITSTFLVMASSVSYAGTSYSSSLNSNSANPLIALLKMSVALVFVLGLLWLLVSVLKRYQSPLAHGKNGLKIVSTFNLGQREKLVVMQVGDEQLLLGVSASSISTLHVLPTPLDAQTPDEKSSFKKVLNAAINKEVSA